MLEPRLRLVASNPAAQQPCSCRTWGLLNRISRDLLLHDFMQWAALLHQVELKLLMRGEHVAVYELLALRPGLGEARRVMTELCAWADCARVTLELTPCAHPDDGLLIGLYRSLGFQPNAEASERFRAREAMIRYPAKGRGHVRLR